jgi:hypothetical protein
MSIPFIEDKQFPLTQMLRSRLNPATAFEVSLDEAITCADRHLHVHGKPQSADIVRLVNEWLNVLRWELATFWSCNPGSHWYDDARGSAEFSPEHPRRVGELLAEGLAIRLLERRLHIPRSKLFFYSGSEARPDFVMRPLRRMSRALLDNDRRLFALECRSRMGWSSIHKSDQEQLKKKKQGKFSGTVAIYSCYGPPSEIENMVRTRYLLGDPPDEADPVTKPTAIRVLLIHYLGVTSRLGLWYHHRELKTALAALEDGVELRKRRDPGMGEDTPLNAVTRRESQYFGRFFSEAIFLYRRGEFTRDEVNRRIHGGQLGEVAYHGLSTEVLRAIRCYDWDALEVYFDKNTLHDPDVGGDGMIKARLNEDSDDYPTVIDAIRSEVR